MLPGPAAIVAMFCNAAAVGSMLAGVIVGQATGAPVPVVEYGALGLCAFMVVQNYRIHDRLGKVIDSQHSCTVDMVRNMSGLIVRNTEAMETCKKMQHRNQRTEPS